MREFPDQKLGLVQRREGAGSSFPICQSITFNHPAMCGCDVLTMPPTVCYTVFFFFNDWLKTIQGVAKSQTRHFLSSLCIGGPLSNQNSYLLLTPFISFPLSFVLLFQEAKTTTGLLIRGELCAEGQAGWPALEGSAQLDLPDVHFEDLSSPAYISFYVTRG